ncbi:MAG: hypothetical protein IKQ46_07920 [Bacteroidales bacterium]|nr:hypothetical protein [Bacteroidales bacterium]
MADLLLFNPGCELEVANGSPVYTPQKFPKILETDLQTLPMFLSNSGDCVAVYSNIDKDYIEFWKDYFPCDFLSINNAARYNELKFNNFRPWGISPRAFYLAKDFNFADDFLKNSPVSEFRSCHKQLFSRETSTKFFRDILLSSDSSAVFPSKDESPLIVKTLDEALDFFHDSMSGRHHGCVFKAPFGSSGRGVRIFRNSSLSDNILQWTQFVIKTQGCVECEVLFDRVCDFSMHYTIKNGKAIFEGVSYFNTADNGFYKSSIVKRFSELPGFEKMSARKLSEIQTKVLNNSVYTELYSGALGIDCMVYRDNGELKINPCVEINCRNSMGRLAMQISNLVCEDSTANFFVYQKKQAEPAFSQKPQFQDGKLKSGFWELTPQNTQIFSAGILATQ